MQQSNGIRLHSSQRSSHPVVLEFIYPSLELTYHSNYILVMLLLLQSEVDAAAEASTPRGAPGIKIRGDKKHWLQGVVVEK